MVGVRTDEPELRFAKGSRLDTDPAGTRPAHRGGQPLALRRAPRPVRGHRRPGRRRGAARHVAARRLRDPRPARTTPTSSATATSSASPSAPSTAPPSARSTTCCTPARTSWSSSRSDGREVMVPFVLPIVPEVDVAVGVPGDRPPAPRACLNHGDCPDDANPALRHGSP